MSVELLIEEAEILPMEGLLGDEEINYGTTLDNPKALKKHMKNSHLGVNGDEDELLKADKSKTKFECSYCDSTFRKEHNLVLHIREDHDDEDLDDESIKFDIDIVRPKKNLNECPECGLDYHIESELKRHMELRHSDLTSVSEAVFDELKEAEQTSDTTEQLLAQEDSGAENDVFSEKVSLDEVSSGSSGLEVKGDEIELDGEALSIEVMDFDIDQYVVEEEKNPSESQVVPVCEVVKKVSDGNGFEEYGNPPLETASGEDDQPQVATSKKQPAVEEPAVEEPAVEEPAVEEPAVEEPAAEEPVAEEHAVEEPAGDEFAVVDEDTTELDGESIVMDDDAFSLLESAMQMTMSIPDDSDDEDNVPLSSRKRKARSSKKVVKKKRGRPSKKSKDDVEILLDGEAVVEDLDSSADDDIVLVDEVNIVQTKDSSGEESESETEDDDPDFTPVPSKKGKKDSSKVSLRKSTRTKKASKPIQIIPQAKEKVTAKEKVIAKGRTKISIVPVTNSVPALKAIPKSTRVVFNNGNSQTGLVKGRNTGSNDATQSAKKTLIFKQKIVQNQCSKCPKSFERKTLLDQHVKSAHIHKCPKCRQNFDLAEKLTVHMRTHFIKCDKCSFSADSKQKVLDHKKVAHNFRCSKCRQCFDQKDRLEAHIKANHFFRCGKCNVTFDVKNLFEDHNKKNHYFPCGSCNKVFDMRQRLASHDKAAHQSCDVCEDEFNWPEPGHSCYYTKNNIRPVIKC